MDLWKINIVQKDIGCPFTQPEILDLETEPLIEHHIYPTSHIEDSEIERM